MTIKQLRDVLKTEARDSAADTAVTDEEHVPVTAVSRRELMAIGQRKLLNEYL